PNRQLAIHPNCSPGKAPKQVPYVNRLNRWTTSPLSRYVTREQAPTSKAEVLRRIRELKTEGFSLKAIADRLNADGVPTISGRWKWQKGTIGNLLAGKGATSGRRGGN